jgi:hypothetical protein
MLGKRLSQIGIILPTGGLLPGFPRPMEIHIVDHGFFLFSR